MTPTEEKLTADPSLPPGQPWSSGSSGPTTFASVVKSTENYMNTFHILEQA